MLGAVGLCVFAAVFFTPVFFLIWFTGVPLIAGGAAFATGVLAVMKAAKLVAEGIACLRYR